MSNKTKAIFALYPTVTNLIDEQNAFDKDGNIVELNEAAINTEIARLQAEYDAKEYQRKRAAEFPPITDYLDGIVKGDQAQIDAYIAACQAVKTKYPKPE